MSSVTPLFHGPGTVSDATNAGAPPRRELDSALDPALKETTHQFPGACAIIATMRSRLQAVGLPSDVGEFSEEARRVFLELGRISSPDALTGECTPAVDVYETDEAVEVVMDLPGVESGAVRVVIKGAAVLLAGEKTPRRGRGDFTFHLVERDFGRFARLVRLSAACDGGRAIQVPVTTAQPTK